MLLRTRLMIGMVLALSALIGGCTTVEGESLDESSITWATDSRTRILSIVTDAGITCVDGECRADPVRRTFGFTYEGRELEVVRFGAAHQADIDDWVHGAVFWGAEVLVGEGWGIAYYGPSSRIEEIRSYLGDGKIAAQLVDGKVVVANSPDT